MRTCTIGASGRIGRALYRSGEPGQATAIRYAAGELVILDGGELVAAVTIAPADRGRVGGAIRHMRTIARRDGESGHKREYELHAGGFFGVHATAARVSIHLGATRRQLVLTYVQLEPIVAGRLASEIEAA